MLEIIFCAHSAIAQKFRKFASMLQSRLSFRKKITLYWVLVLRIYNLLSTISKQEALSLKQGKNSPSVWNVQTCRQKKNILF